ncbi:MAG: DUF3540 domain-containing protein [bacterium]|nr:DUF3540 domain-containing protein [bacterium]
MNTLTATSYLGPAKVVEARTGRILVAMPDKKAWVTPAMQFTYEASAGDTLLVIGQDDLFYAIGVLNGSGRTALQVPGDLDLQAPHGRIRMQARDGLEFRAKAVQFVAEAWDAALGTVRQSCEELWTKVRGAMRISTRRRETRIRETDRTRAGRIIQTAAKDVQIDGEKIHLG